MNALPQGEEKARAVQRMFDRIAPRYDLVNRVMTFGLDTGWRRKTVRALGLSPGARVLDLACGTGDLCRALAREGYLPVGVDFAWGMLAAARTRAPLVQADILRLPVAPGSVDGATCGFALRNVEDLGALFRQMNRAIRPGGRIALLEVFEPRRAILRRGHSVYFNKVVPAIGGALSSKEAYSYLPRSVAYLPPADELLARIAAAGFTGVERRSLSGGIVQLITGTRA